MYCRKCGTQIPDDSLFCMNCGAAVSASVPAALGTRYIETSDEYLAEAPLSSDDDPQGSRDDALYEESTSPRTAQKGTEVGWGFSIAFFLLGIIALFSFGWAALLIIFAGVVLNPGIRNLLHMKTWRSVLLCILSIIFFFPAAAFSSKKSNESTEEVARVSVDPTPTATPISKDAVMERAASVDYKDLLRTPSKYKGNYISVKVEVYQILNTGLLNSQKYYFGRTKSAGGLYWGDEYGFTDNRINDSTKILESDVITVYGKFAGLEKFSRALTSAEAEIPIIEMLYVDIQGVGDTDSTPRPMTMKQNDG